MKFKTLLVIITASLFFSLPKILAQGPTTSIGDNTGVPLYALSNNDIDQVVALNGGQTGGSLVVRVNQGIVETMQDHFNNLLNYASSQGVTIIIQTDGMVSPQGLANFLNNGLQSAPQTPNIPLVIENEANDKNQSNFSGSGADRAANYADYFASIGQTLSANPFLNQRTTLMMSNLNVTCPNVSFCQSAPNWYQQMYNHNPTAFTYLEALASSAYGVAPQFDLNSEGTLVFQKELAFLHNLTGSDNFNPQSFPVYIIETGLQPNNAQQQQTYGPSQLSFLQTVLPFWLQSHNIVSINWFNATGTNPDPQWSFFNFLNLPDDQLAQAISLFSALKKNALIVSGAQVQIDPSKLYRCEDKNKKFIGYTVDEKSCQTLLELLKKRILSFTPQRQISPGTDIYQSISDPVRLQQSVTANAPISVTPGGFFEEFQDMTLPFAKNLVQYLAGPFVYQGPKKIKEALDSGKIMEKTGVLSKLTPKEIQDRMRAEYKKRCSIATCPSPQTGNDIFCSDLNIRDDCQTCLNQTTNECLIADSTPIHQIQPSDTKRWLQIPLYSNPLTKTESAIYIDSCTDVKGDESQTTAEIYVPSLSALKEVSSFLHSLLSPAFSSNSPISPSSLNTPNSPTSPKKLLASKNPLLAQGPDQSQNVQWSDLSFTITGSPGNYQLNYLVTVYSYNNNDYTADLWTPAGAVHLANGNMCGGNPRGCPPNSQDENGKPVWKLTFCSQGIENCDHTVGSPISLANIPPQGANISVNLSGSNKGATCTAKPGQPPQNCTAVTSAFFMAGIQNQCQPPAPPPYRSAPGEPLLIKEDGHALARGQTQKCQPTDQPGQYTCPQYNEPLWPVVKYPFLQTIHQKLTDVGGLFHFFVPWNLEKGETVESVTANWTEAGESKITYCFTDHPATSMIKGGALQEYQKEFTKPPGRCSDDYTRGLSVYPDFLGGFQNAKDWLTQKLLQPSSNKPSP